MLWALGNHAYSNILKILPPKKQKNSDKNSDIIHISVQNTGCGYSLEPQRGSSNKYPQSVLSRNKNNNVYSCKPQFCYIKVGFKGVNIIRHVFLMGNSLEPPRHTSIEYHNICFPGEIKKKNITTFY